MNNSKVSVIVPVYNASAYLTNAVQSVVQQTYKNLEILLIDDGSTDGSGKLCDELAAQDDRIRVVHADKNYGVSVARNTGVKEAKGEWLAFVDADDKVHPEYISRMVQAVTTHGVKMAICRHEDLYIVGHDKLITLHPGVYMRKLDEDRVVGADDTICNILYQHVIGSVWGKLFHRSLFTNVTFPIATINEDYAVMPRLCDNADKIVVITDTLYTYHHREGSLSHHDFDKNSLDILLVNRALSNYLSGRSEEIYAALLSFRLSAALRIVLNCPDNEFTYITDMCHTIVNNFGWTMLMDKRIRNKLRMAIILFYISPKLLKKVYFNKINRINRGG